MKLQQKEISELTQLAVKASKLAGAQIANALGAQFEIKKKKEGVTIASQVVTEIDFQSQDIILNTLSHTLESFDLALLAEESVDNKSRFEKDYFWCIDPLDGTLPFTEGKSGFSVSIGLVERSGRPCIGVVYDPFANILYHAGKDIGVFCNDKLWKPKPAHLSSEERYTLVVDRSFFDDPESEGIVAAFSEIVKLDGFMELEVINIGGAVMNAIWALTHPASCYFKFPKKNNRGGSLWDYAATASIYSEAGAIACDIFGQPFDLNRSDSTFMNHKGIIFATEQRIVSCIMKMYEELG